MPLPLLPDPQDLTVKALLAQTAVTALVSTRISDRTPGSPTYPLLVVRTVDEDEGDDPSQGRAREQVDCWGKGPGPDDSAAALAIARTIRSIARDLAGTYATGAITSCTPGQVIPAPDPSTGRARFVIDLLVETHA